MYSLKGCGLPSSPLRASARRSAPSTQRAPAHRLARAMAADDVTHGGVPRAGDRRLPAGRPRAVARLRRRRSGASSSASRADTATLATVFVLGLAVARRRAALQLRGDRPPRPHPRLRPQGEAAHLQRLLRRPHVLARRARAVARRAAACRSATIVFTFDFGTVAIEVCEDVWSPDGPMRRRSLRGRRDRRQRLGVAVPHGRRRHAARDARHPRGRQPDRAALRQRGRRPGRPDLRRRRLRLPERPARASRRRASARAGGRPSSISIARSGCGIENTTWRTDCETFAPAAQRPCAVIQSDGADRRSIQARYPAPKAAASSCRPAGRRTWTRGTGLDDLFDALALGVKTTSRRPARSRRSASRSRAGATRCSRCWSPGAPPSSSSRRTGARSTAFYMPSRYSQDATRAAAQSARRRSSARTLEVVPDRRGLRARARGRRAHAGRQPRRPS